MNGTAGKWNKRGAMLGGVLFSLAILVVVTPGLRQVGTGSAQGLRPAVTAATAAQVAWRVESQAQPSATRTPFQPQRATPSPTPVPTATATATATLPPPPPPPEPEAPDELPDQAVVQGVTGYFQSLPLSCESRSAADWARFFGVTINELEFQERLPRSDNPEQGFVGNPRDMAGMIPPNSYGAHASPVAELLRAYGLPAEARQGIGFEVLQHELADGRPAIVWVIGSVLPGRAVEYTASDGQTTLVASLEHTVMIVGYTDSTVQIVDGGLYYSAALPRFLSSWGVLGNQAVVYDE